MLRWLRRFAPFVACVVIALPWLNQGWSLARTEATRAAIDAGRAPGFERLRYPVAFLYRRSADEELYYADARAIRGKPYDHRLLAEVRGSMPARFRDFPVADGRWHRPYTEVPIEYPAAILPVLLGVEALFGATFERFAHAFGWVIGACLLAATWLTTRATVAPGVATPFDQRTASERAWGLSALLLAQGGLAVQRLDGLVTLCGAWAFVAALKRRPGQLGVALGIATALKFVPALVFLPMLAVDREWWSSRGARRALATGFGGAAFLGLFPMLFPSSALLEVLRYHTDRGLHVESMAGSVVALGRWIMGTATPSTSSFGSFNLVGAVPDVLAHALGPLLVLAIVALAGTLAVRAARADAEDAAGRADALALGILGGMAALWILGKVFSPQYMTWAIPIVLVVSGPRGRTLTWLLVAAMGVTQLYIRGFYDEVTDLHAVGLVALAVRQSFVLAFGFVAARAVVERGGLPASFGRDAVPARKG